MEKDKYIVINSEDIQKRIEELEKQRNKDKEDFDWNGLNLGELNTLKRILSKSKPLTPIIENAFDEGQTRSLGLTKKGYINNLKLDI